ncbi:beta-mannosidase [Microbacterium sorbitolivorans]|uniref:beta-mannosidase n=1 Tax=Microbacterium sorbitolivorans TaxID=1867410 RepID=A0A367XUC1_9MICO|nr:glycoside hydrolase family 2 protein [Microbacterium sorbitolivorans]RCK57217.1 glycoside hydrolase family 2 protein [Microbacterium sorbitolivorans]GGF45680.1 beta-mannosidase [Microbacterium sorbitolivorans]
MTVIPLTDDWTFTAVSGPAPDAIAGRAIPARVPGSVHLDLERAGLIAAPFDGANETEQQWIGDVDWRFETSFEWSDDGSDRRELVAEGLDTLAVVTLNGVEVGRTQNQHRSYRLDIGEALREGRNELVIDFAAPVPAAHARSEEHGERFHVNHHPYNALRKMASSFGWDWGIDVAAAGIWRPIRVEGWSTARIASVRPLVSVAGTTGVVDAHIEIDRADHLTADTLRVEVEIAGVVREAEVTGSAAHVRVEVPDAELWWPRGHGEQPLYDIEVRLAGGSPDARLDAWSRRIGFRTVRVDVAADEHGSPFALHVNGRLVQVRGANWIPDHAFITEVDRDRYRRRIADATDANMNLLRVWGGGIYESDDFYELCDEQGVLVWQDFLFACAAYAEEEWLASEVEAEAREAITRLSSHPSLVVWCGNNENIVGYSEWGWRKDLGGKTWGDGYYRRVLPGLLAELDSTRFYAAGSPYSFSRYISPNLDTHGTVHIWDVWNEKDYAHYRDWKPRFVAEFGFQGPPAWTTLVESVHDSPMDPYGEQMLVHQKANEGNLKLERGYGPHLPEPRTIEDWHWATQLNQAAAMRFGISYFRSLAPYNTGTIVWQLNDDWPVISWAAVDFAERRKPLWYALKAVYEPRFATVQPSADGLAVTLLNDIDEDWEGEVAARRLTFAGEVLAEERIPAAVAARGAATIELPASVAVAADAAGEVLEVEADGLARTLHDFAEVKDQSLAADPLEIEASRDGDAVRIRVTARSYVRDAMILADRGHRDASVDTGLVSLLAGESHEFVVSGAPGDADPTAFAARDVLRHAGDLRG